MFFEKQCYCTFKLSLKMGFLLSFLSFFLFFLFFQVKRKYHACIYLFILSKSLRIYLDYWFSHVELYIISFRTCLAESTPHLFECSNCLQGQRKIQSEVAVHCILMITEGVHKDSDDAVPIRRKSKKLFLLEIRCQELDRKTDKSLL